MHTIARLDGRTSPATGEDSTAELGYHDAMSNLSTTAPGWRRTVTRSATTAVAALLAGGMMLIAACSPSGSTASSAQSAKANPAAHVSGSPVPAATATVNCKTIDSLRASLVSLSHTSVSPGSATAVAADLTNIQKQLAALKSQPHGAFSSQANELTAAMDQIKKAAAELPAHPMAGARQLTGDLAALKSKAQPMISEMNKLCPKSTT
jgi:hypothetical protein